MHKCNLRLFWLYVKKTAPILIYICCRSYRKTSKVLTHGHCIAVATVIKREDESTTEGQEWICPHTFDIVVTGMSECTARISPTWMTFAAIWRVCGEPRKSQILNSCPTIRPQFRAIHRSDLFTSNDTLVRKGSIEFSTYLSYSSHLHYCLSISASIALRELNPYTL